MPPHNVDSLVSREANKIGTRSTIDHCGLQEGQQESILTCLVKETHKDPCRVHKKGPVGCKKCSFFAKLFLDFFSVKHSVPILG